MNITRPTFEAFRFKTPYPAALTAAMHSYLASSRHRFLTSLGISLLVLSIVSPPVFSASTKDISGNGTSADPIAAYGEKAVYTIKRNGKKIGKHSVEFSEPGEELKVSVVSALTVTVLKIPVYRFRYTSEERWLNGQLQNVIASTTEKGKTTTVSMQRLGDSMVLQNAKGEVTREQVEFSSNHWNPGVLSADRLFNTLTAKANRIEIERVGTETLNINNQAVEATHFRYSGELRVDVWYDEQNRWVRLAFAGSDGSDIEYISDGFDGKP